MEGGCCGELVHPLRAALCLHASPSRSEGEGTKFKKGEIRDDGF